MRVLVLGGTAWLGGQIASAAADQGHEVTCLARGESGDPPPRVRFVRGDRTSVAGYAPVADEAWDACIDVARQPGQVRSAVRALRGVQRYVFVSSASVYADHSTPGADESAALLDPLAADEYTDPEEYGSAKVACENVVLDAFGDRAFVARAGLIGGPGDSSGRTGYWPLRFARPAAADGRVLVPDEPELGTQVVDARDLAAWLVDAAAHERSGIVNAVGPQVPLAEHVATARAVAGHTGEVVSVKPSWLIEHGVEPWMGPRSLPMWLPMPDYAGFGARAASAARLPTRPLADTLADTLAWELSQPAERTRRAGLTDDEERELLDALG